MSLEAQLNAYLQTAGIQAQVRAWIQRNGTGLLESQVMQYVEEAKDKIIDSLPPSLKEGSNRPITRGDLIASPISINAVGEYEVELSWNPKAVMRDSLYLDGDDPYVENIVSLFSSGTKPLKNPVFGTYRGKNSALYTQYFIPRGYSRAADTFLLDAIREFNAKYASLGIRLTAPLSYFAH